MNIHENTALLDAFVDGELTAEALSTVQSHLDACPGCRAYVEDALAIRAAFPTEDDIPLPADFTENIMAAVAKAPQSRPKKQPWGKLAAAAACLALIVAVQRVGLPIKAESANSTAAYVADTAAEKTDIAPMERSVEAPAAMEAETGTVNGSSAAYSMDSAPAETQAESDTAAKEEGLADESALTDLPTVRLSAPDLGDLLADYTPEEQTPTSARYLLTREEFDALAAILAERGISVETDDGTSPQLWLEVYGE